MGNIKEGTDLIANIESSIIDRVNFNNNPDDLKTTRVKLESVVRDVFMEAAKRMPQSQAYKRLSAKMNGLRKENASLNFNELNQNTNLASITGYDNGMVESDGLAPVDLYIGSNNNSINAIKSETRAYDKNENDRFSQQGNNNEVQADGTASNDEYPGLNDIVNGISGDKKLPEPKVLQVTQERNLEKILEKNANILSKTSFPEKWAYMESNLEYIGFQVERYGNNDYDIIPKYEGGSAYVYPSIKGNIRAENGYIERTPSQLVDKLLSNAENLFLECNSFVSLIRTASIRDYIGEEKFNEFYPSKVINEGTSREGVFYKVDAMRMGRYPGFGEYMQSESFDSDEEGQQKAKQSVQDTGLGTIIVLTAKDENAIEDRALINENIIKIGSDEYAATGLAEKKIFKFDEIIGNLNEKAGGRTEYYVKSINEIDYEALVAEAEKKVTNQLYWIDAETGERIETLASGKKARLCFETQGYLAGETVKASVTWNDGRKFADDSTELVYSGTVDESGKAVSNEVWGGDAEEDIQPAGQYKYKRVLDAAGKPILIPINAVPTFYTGTDEVNPYLSSNKKKVDNTAGYLAYFEIKDEETGETKKYESMYHLNGKFIRYEYPRKRDRGNVTRYPYVVPENVDESEIAPEEITVEHNLLMPESTVAGNGGEQNREEAKPATSYKYKRITNPSGKTTLVPVDAIPVCYIGTSDRLNAFKIGDEIYRAVYYYPHRNREFRQYITRLAKPYWVKSNVPESEIMPDELVPEIQPTGGNEQWIYKMGLEGGTLEYIAKQFKVPLDELKELNYPSHKHKPSLDNLFLLRGSSIIIPLCSYDQEPTAGARSNVVVPEPEVAGNEDTPVMPTENNQPAPLPENTLPEEVKPEEKKFKLTRLRAIDTKYKERIAEAGQTLYYINNDNKDTIFEATISPDLSLKEINKERIQWYYDRVYQQQHDGKKIFTETVEKNKNVNVIVKAGMPVPDEKNVKIEWVKNYNKQMEVVPPGITNALDQLSKYLTELAKPLSKIFKKAKLEVNIPYSGEEYVEIDETSRFYYTKRTGGFSGSISLVFEVEKPVLPGIKFANIAIYAKPYISLSALGSIEFAKRNDEKAFTKRGIQMGFGLSSDLEVGGKITCNIGIDFEGKVYGGAAVGGAVKYISSQNVINISGSIGKPYWGFEIESKLDDYNILPTPTYRYTWENIVLNFNHDIKLE